MLEQKMVHWQNEKQKADQTDYNIIQTITGNLSNTYTNKKYIGH